MGEEKSFSFPLGVGRGNRPLALRAVLLAEPRTGVLDRDLRGVGSLNLDLARVVVGILLRGGGPRSLLRIRNGDGVATGGSELVFEEASGAAFAAVAVSDEVLDSLLITGVNVTVAFGGSASMLPLLSNDFLGETGGVTLCRGAVVSLLTTSTLSKACSS